MSPSTDGDLGLQFASLFALNGLHNNTSLWLGTAIMDSIECVILQTHPTKEAQAPQQPRQSTEAHVCNSPLLSHLSSAAIVPFESMQSRQPWARLEGEINGRSARMCAFDLWTVVYVSGGRAIVTAISQQTRKRSPSVDPPASDTYLAQQRTPSRDWRDLLQREEEVEGGELAGFCAILSFH